MGNDLPLGALDVDLDEVEGAFGQKAGEVDGRDLLPGRFTVRGLGLGVGDPAAIAAVGQETKRGVFGPRRRLDHLDVLVAETGEVGAEQGRDFGVGPRR